ncbi:MAG: protein-disulfide reductase DsbD domain-containing protein, partial [Gemmatimonadales bacterium]
MHRAGATGLRQRHRFASRVIAAALLCAAAPLSAQERPVTWTLVAPRATRAPFTAVLHATIGDGWYLYSQTEPPGGPVATSVAGIGDEYTLAGVPAAPEAERRPDANFNIISEVYTDSVRFTLAVRRTGTNPNSNASALRVAVRFQTCTIHYCLPPRTDTVVATVSSQRAAAHVPPAGPAAAAAPSPGRAPTTSVRPSPHAPPGRAATGLVAFLSLACVTAFFALLTPCVFPMVPVTVGFFTGRSGGGRSGALRDATLFAAGIVGSFAALGLTVSALFGAGDIVRFAANPWLNLT